MSGAGLCILVPALAALPAALLARHAAARWVHAAACLATLALTLRLAWRQPVLDGWLTDPLALAAAVLTAAVALAGAAAAPVPAPRPERTAGFSPAAALILLAGLLLGLLADSAILAWSGLAVAMAVASAPLLARPPGSSGSASVLPAAASLVLALLGAMLLSRVATRVGLPMAPVRGNLSLLQAPGVTLDPGLLGLACAFSLSGLAVPAGLAPVQGWLAATQRAASPPVAVLLCAPLPSLALLLLLRLGRVAAEAGLALWGDGLLTLGLASVLLGAAALCRRPATPALLTLLHGGVGAVAFGLGTTAALYAGLLHMACSSLARAADVLGAVADPGLHPGAAPDQAAGNAHPAQLDEPGATLRCAGLRLAVTLALAGVPPLALFPAELLLLAALLARSPALAVLLALGLLAAGIGVLGRMTRAVPEMWPARAAAWTLLGLAMLAGLAMPEALAGWLTRIAETLAVPG